MNALIDSTPLEHPLWLKSGFVIRTIGEAGLFIIKLPKEHDGRVHWSTAGVNLQAASRFPDNSDLLQTATMSMENALKTERMLLDQAPGT